MDYTQALQPRSKALWHLIPLVIFAAVTKSRWFKVKAGKIVVSLSATFFLDKTRYHLIKNVTTPVVGGSSELKLIFVSWFPVIFFWKPGT